MYLFVEALTGLIIRLNVVPEDTIQSIKYKIMVCEDLPVDEQHLIYQYKDLEDHRTLSFYNIIHNTTIRLIMKMRGGPLSVDTTYEELLSESDTNYLSEQLAIIFLENGELRFLPVQGLDMQSKLIKQTKEDLNDPSIFSSSEEPVTNQKLTILKLKMDCIRLGKKLSNMTRQHDHSMSIEKSEDQPSRPIRSVNSVLHRSVSLDSRPSTFIPEVSNCVNKLKNSNSPSNPSRSPSFGIYRTMSFLDTTKINKSSVSYFPPIQNLSKNRQKLNEYCQSFKELKSESKCLKSIGYESRLRLPPLDESEFENKKVVSKHTRCTICSKKMSITNEFVCRCGSHFCSKHRYPEEHSCRYDFKSNGKIELIKSNPMIKAEKVARI